MHRRDVRRLSLSVAALGLFATAALAQHAPPRASNLPVAPPPPATQPADGPQPRIELDGTEFDFGTVWAGQEARKEFTVRNTGPAPLIVSVRSTCGCTVAESPRSPLPPGESDTFTIRYDTKRVGSAHKLVYVESNDPASARLTITIQGEVRPLFKTTPERLVLSDLDVDTERAETITLENNYDRPVHLKLAEKQEFGKFDVRLRAVEEGQKYELVVKTLPPLRVGFNRANVKLDTDVDVLPELELWVSANAQPAVSVFPFRLLIPATKREPYDQIINVQHRADLDLRVLDIRGSWPGFAYRERESRATPRGRFGSQLFVVTLPAWESVPEEGLTLTVVTNDEGKYARIEVPVTRGPQIRPPAPSAAPLGRSPQGGAAGGGGAQSSPGAE